MKSRTYNWLTVFSSLLWLTTSVVAEDPQVLRLGMIGLDTSHAPAFAKALNASPARPGLEGLRIVAAVPGSSPDLPVSADRVENFTKAVEGEGITIVQSVEELLPMVDAVLLTSVDGRRHPEFAKAVILGGKPLFIDKPMTNSVEEAQEIFKLAKEHNVPCFSSSSLRFSPGVIEHRKDSAMGEILGCDITGPCSTQLHHPDLFWYGIHGVEMLFTVMGPGCESVTCTRTPGADVVVGKWKDGRIGTFRGIRSGAARYGVTITGSVQSGSTNVSAGYEPLLVEIGQFFRTGVSPVPEQETLEILAFMQAANQSHEQGGIPVLLNTAP